MNTKKKYLDPQPTVSEVLPHVVLDLLCPHAPVALLEEFFNAQSPLLRRIRPNEAHPASAAATRGHYGGGQAINGAYLILRNVLRLMKL